MNFYPIASNSNFILSDSLMIVVQHTKCNQKYRLSFAFGSKHLLTESKKKKNLLVISIPVFTVLILSSCSILYAYP